MKFKRLTAAVLAVFLAAASAMETFAEEQTEQFQERIPQKPL